MDDTEKGVLKFYTLMALAGYIGYRASGRRILGGVLGVAIPPIILINSINNLRY